MENRPHFLVLIRVRKQYLLSARNSIIVQRPIIENYHGCILGLTDAICPIEGCWINNDGIICILFPSEFYVERFMVGTPDIMQQDWQSGADIVSIELGRLPKGGNKMIFQMTNVNSRNPLQFSTYHLPALISDLEEYGGNSCLVSTRNVKNLRGAWNLDMVLMHQWDDSNSFHKWFNSPQQVSARKEASINSFLTTFLFQLKSITTCGFTNCKQLK